MMKILWLLILFLSTTCAFSSEFELLMGRGTAAWQHVKTEEDRSSLKVFEKLYEKNGSLLSAKRASIPHVIHCIWLGKEPFPTASLKQVRSWIAKHPTWKINFWTDIDRPVPLPQMEKRLVEDFTFTTLFDCYDRADNLFEKSLILRYEILWQEGGVYLDHDLLLLASLEELTDNFDFYSGLECLGPTILSSSVFVSPHLIASRPHHPILEKTIDWLFLHWQELENAFAGPTAQSSLAKRRSFTAFTEGINQGVDLKEDRDIIFPSHYFSMPRGKAARFAYHLHEGTWQQNESPKEKNMKLELDALLQKNAWLVSIAFVLVGFNLLALIFFFKIVKKSAAA